MMYWIANILYGTTDTKSLIGIEFTEDEYRKYRQSLEYVFQVRNALHNIARKKQDQVTFDILPELSTKLGFKNTPRHTKDNCNHTAHLASMSIIAEDQKGLFAHIAKIFDDFNIEIESAKLHTIKGFANDLFLIEKNGNFCGHQDDIIDLMCEESKTK